MKNVLEYLENSAARRPRRTAVRANALTCDYQTLLQTSRAVGSGLAPTLTMGSPVAVLLDKSPDALFAFWGAVYAGGFYVPLEPSLPEQRLRQIQSVLQACCVITDRQHRPLAEAIFPAEAVLDIEALKTATLDENALTRVRRRMIDSDPLYANFTSGSTGAPKGVVVSHRSVIDFIDVFTETFELTEEDVFGNQAPLDFDVSVKDLYSCLKLGATLVLLERPLFSRPRELLDRLCRQQVTVLVWAVSALCLISTFHGLDYRTPERIRKVLFSGEVMPEKHLQSWMEHLPAAQFVNLYGPTEITCNCTYHIIDPRRRYERGIPIGRPFANEDVFLLDETGQEITEANVSGELCVRGAALALGYYRSPEQTAAAFCQDPRHDRYPERIYRTGDLASYDQQGELLFGGRRDFQIKYLGHRIELEEIEGAVAGLPGVDRCCCLFDNEKEKLYGFYTGSAEPAALREQLSRLLPAYMIPRSLCRLTEFPLTKNGKIDRKWLLERKPANKKSSPKEDLTKNNLAGSR